MNNNTPTCLINCDGNDLMRRTSIYAMNGFNDIVINSKHYPSSNWCYRSGQMQCDPQYTTVCDMNTEEPFQCTDATNPCNPITTKSPTYEPTLEPTLEDTNAKTTEFDFDFEFSTTYYDDMTSTKIINSMDIQRENWMESNEFMTIIVVVGIIFIIICMAFCISCHKRINSRKIDERNMEQIPGQMNQEIGDCEDENDHNEDESIEYQYDYNYNVSTQRNRYGNMRIKVGEYDVVPSQPIYDYEIS
eukprot:CAMPEP_0201574796 /NCGR_PEP_ID=MMETSP0190_2-20130828/19524_1 /ASSEMBLY_ACC=CAM_ASM_000263 /TAXON_ID=37353 /ORGANISM="Rosalina sp." /LENGTH=245 /DNA_ID=CAMNT_0048003545 /DNA_START=200 /DNA_END=937 /DNA_ORIENTATION=-